MTSWVTLLLRHFIRVRDNAWNPRVFVETGGRGKRLKPTGEENLYHQIHVASTRRAKSTRLAWESHQIGDLVLLTSIAHAQKLSMKKHILYRILAYIKEKNQNKAL